MSRPTLVWKFGNEAMRLGERTFLAGAVPLNASDAGQAVEQAFRLEEQGADFIELQADVWVGGKAPISAEAELLRIVPVIKKLIPKLTIPLAVETSKSEVARRTIELGAKIIADPSTLTFDVNLARIVAEGNAGLIIRHLRGVPEQWPKLGTPKDIVQAVLEELSAAVSRAARGGLPKASVVVDPGFGLGKRKEQNSLLLAELGILHRLKAPVMACLSRQSFVTTPAVEPSDLMTAGTATAAVLKGAHILRLEDISAARDAILAADGLLAAAAPPIPHQTGVHRAVPAPEPPPEPKRQALRPPVKR